MSRAPDDRQQSFVLFGEHWAGLSILTDAQRGRLLQALYAEHGFCEMPELDQATRGVMAMMLPRMKANWELYQESRKRRQEAGRKGGLAGGKSSNPEQSEAMLSNAKQCLDMPSTTEQCQHGTGSGTGTVNGTGTDFKRSPPSPPPGGARERAKKVDLRLLDFEEWYRTYPKHEKRGDAQKAWEKAVRAGTLPPLQSLLDALSWQRRKEQWRDYNFIPLPASYLNAQAWLDEKPKASARPARGPAQQYRPSQEEIAAQRTFQNGMDVLAELEEERRRKEEN